MLLFYINLVEQNTSYWYKFFAYELIEIIQTQHLLTAQYIKVIAKILYVGVSKAILYKVHSV